MASSDDEGEMSVHVVTSYTFLDKKKEHVSFSVLPIQRSEDDKPHSLSEEIFLEGLSVERCRMVYKQVTAWKFELREEDKYPEVSVLTKENNWVKLLHPTKPYEGAARTILITLHFLHHIKKNLEISRESLWDQLLRVFRLRRLYSIHTVRPGERDLLGHLPLIREVLNRDDTLSKSQSLPTILENLERMKDISSWEDELEDTTCSESDDSPEGSLWEMVEERYRFIKLSKNMSLMTEIEKLRSLAEEAATPAQKTQILMSTVKAQLRTNPTLLGHMPIEVWRNCIQNLSTIFHILQENPNILMNTNHDLLSEIKETKRGKDYDGEILMYGDLFGLVVRVYAEYFWRNKEYIKGLRNEPILTLLCKNAFCYFKWKNDFQNASKVALLLVQLLYSKSAEEYAILVTATEQTNKRKNELNFSETCSLFLDEMSSFIHDHGKLYSKVRATLCHVYHYAIMDNYLMCKTLMLRSDLLDKSKMDIPTQVLYNRMLVQFGLCAFRGGFVTEAHELLNELYATGREKELIGQDISEWHYGDNIPKQENLERRLQTPYHLQVSMVFLESVYLICGMILEIPNMEATRLRERKVVNSTIREWMEWRQTRVLGFPSELVYDQLVAATRALSRLEFDVCLKNIRGLHIWDLVANKDHVLEILETRLKEASLSVFVWRHCLYSVNYSLDMLASRFRLPKAHILGILFDMMSGEFPGNLMEVGSQIKFKREKYRMLTISAARLINKVSVLAEFNENKAKCE